MDVHVTGEGKPAMVLWLGSVCGIRRSSSGPARARGYNCLASPGAPPLPASRRLVTPTKKARPRPARFLGVEDHTHLKTVVQASPALPGARHREVDLSKPPAVIDFSPEAAGKRGCIQNSDFAAAFAASTSGLG